MKICKKIVGFSIAMIDYRRVCKVHQQSPSPPAMGAINRIHNKQLAQMVVCFWPGVNPIFIIPSGNLTWLLKMAIEIVDFPIKKWWFSIVMLVYQRVGHQESPRVHQLRGSSLPSCAKVTWACPWCAWPPAVSLEIVVLDHVDHHRILYLVAL